MCIRDRAIDATNCYIKLSDNFCESINCIYFILGDLVITKKILSKDLLVNPSEDLNHSWEHDNQAWWDWYVTLADNSGKDKAADFVDVEPIKHFDMPSDNQLEDELSSLYNLTDEHHLAFRRDGFIRLPNILSPGAIVRLREELTNLLNKTFPKNNRSNRFLSLEMMWLELSLIHI